VVRGRIAMRGRADLPLPVRPIPPAPAWRQFSRCKIENRGGPKTLIKKTNPTEAPWKFVPRDLSRLAN
jgi:hypothetical protein